jgi:membrane associated rhomboid family serine protease
MIPLRDDQPCFSTPFVTWFLIGINVLVFLFELSIGFQSRADLNALMAQFGVVPSHSIGLLTGTPVFAPLAAILPIFTSMFLHASWSHVLGNMLVLWIFGDNIEDHLGHFKYLVFYLLCGFAASFTHIVLNPNSLVPSVGASGAIAGVMGAYFVLFPRAKVLVWFPPIFLFKVPAWLMLGYWFVAQFISGTATSIASANEAAGGGIAFWAHVGGFVAGVLLIKLLPERPQRYRYGTW